MPGTLFQTKNAKGFIQSPRGLSAGVVMAARGLYIASTAYTTATDKVEMLILPPFCRVTDMIVIGELAAAVTMTMGFLTGEAGLNDNDRTQNSVFFSGQAVNNTVSRMSLTTGFKQASVDYPRGIGMTINTDIAASAAKTVELIMYYSPDY